MRNLVAGLLIVVGVVALAWGASGCRMVVSPRLDRYYARAGLGVGVGLGPSLAPPDRGAERVAVALGAGLAATGALLRRRSRASEGPQREKP